MTEEQLARATAGEYEGDYALAVYDLRHLAAEVKRLRAMLTRPATCPHCIALGTYLELGWYCLECGHMER